MKKSRSEEVNTLRQRNLEDFLCSYRNQKAMAQLDGRDEDESFETSGNVKAAEPRPFNTDLAAGQIRLLKDVSRITYVALLRRWEEDSYVVMAFSHYDFPATDAEFTTRVSGGCYLNVLQAWNTRTLRDETLKKSWLVGSLGEEDLEDAWTLWSHQISGCKLSEDLLARTGTEIVDPKDERIAYLREELAVFAKVDAVDFQGTQEEEPKADLPWLSGFEFPTLWDHSAERLAAGPEKDDECFDCQIDEHPEKFQISYSPQEKKLRFRVFATDGETSSVAFDGWTVLNENGETLGTLANGHCVVKDVSVPVGAFALREPSGLVHALAPIEEGRE